MASGRVQVATTGIQDAFLTGNPDITYFQKQFKRHTKFSLELLDNPFDEAPDFGKTVTCTIGRRGDLIRNIYLRMDLPAIDVAQLRYTASIGNALIEYADLIIGGKRVERINGEYMEIYGELFVDESQQRALDYVAGKAYHKNALGSATTGLYPRNFIVQLPFYFVRSDPLSIPLVALDYQEVEVTIKFRDLDRVLVNPVNDGSTVPSGKSMSNVTLPVEYVFLSDGEINQFRNQKSDYVISQLQMQRFRTNSLENQIKLEFINPVKELYIVVQDMSKVQSNLYLGNDWFNYENSSNADVNYQHLRSLKLDFNNETMIDDSVADALFLNYLQPMNRHTRVPQRKIYNYSFSIDPENYLPTGQVNMSRIINKLLTLNLNYSANGEREIRIYAKSYNILRVENGLSGMLFIDNNVY